MSGPLLSAATPAPLPTPLGDAPSATGKPVWERLRWATRPVRRHDSDPAMQNARTIYERRLSRLERFAVAITKRVGSFGFFLVIFTWTVGWCGYNIVASEIKSLHWKAFDPFPAFVAYLLISNVIQILLMPLILIGQNLDSRFADTRAELDFEVNRMAEKEATAVLCHLEHQTNLLLLLMRHVQVEIPEEELLALEEAMREEEQLVQTDPVSQTQMQ